MDGVAWTVWRGRSGVVWRGRSVVDGRHRCHGRSTWGGRSGMDGLGRAGGSRSARLPRRTQPTRQHSRAPMRRPRRGPPKAAIRSSQRVAIARSRCGPRLVNKNAKQPKVRLLRRVQLGERLADAAVGHPEPLPQRHMVQLARQVQHHEVQSAHRRVRARPARRRVHGAHWQGELYVQLRGGRGDFHQRLGGHRRLQGLCLAGPWRRRAAEVSDIVVVFVALSFIGGQS